MITMGSLWVMDASRAITCSPPTPVRMARFESATPPRAPRHAGRSASKPVSPTGAKRTRGVGVIGAAPPRSSATSARSRAISADGVVAAAGSAASMSAATRATTAPQPPSAIVSPAATIEVRRATAAARSSGGMRSIIAPSAALAASDAVTTSSACAASSGEARARAASTPPRAVASAAVIASVMPSMPARPAERIAASSPSTDADELRPAVVMPSISNLAMLMLTIGPPPRRADELMVAVFADASLGTPQASNSAASRRPPIHGLTSSPRRRSASGMVTFSAALPSTLRATCEMASVPAASFSICTDAGMPATVRVDAAEPAFAPTVSTPITAPCTSLSSLALDHSAIRPPTAMTTEARTSLPSRTMTPRFTGTIAQLPSCNRRRVPGSILTIDSTA